jgi:hypothetical protein
MRTGLYPELSTGLELTERRIASVVAMELIRKDVAWRFHLLEVTVCHAAYSPSGSKSMANSSLVTAIVGGGCD